MHFIRHGQSEFNLAFNNTGRDPGISDAPLTHIGRDQAYRAADALSKHKITQIICSPYTRAIQTAEIIAKALKMTRITIEPLVAERCLYSCDIGTPISQMREKWDHLADFTAVTTELWWPQSDESHADLHKRVKLFHKKWGVHSQASETLAVSHWYFLNTLTGKDLRNCENLFHSLTDAE